MGSMKKGFVCQNCGKNVPPKTDRCPHCGRFFKGVRCPQCLYIGVADDFLKGCPACGYLGDTESGVNLQSMPDYLKPAKKELPAWFYLSAIGILIIAVIVLLIIFFNMP